MENRNKNIDRYFKDRLGIFEQKPPEASWDIITKKLGHGRKKGLTLLIFRIAAGMAVLISTGIGFHLLTKLSNQSEQAVLLINQHDVSAKDTIKLKRPYKRNSIAVPEKNSNKSNRLEPVRMVYNRPVMSKGIISEPIISLTRIVDNNRRYLLPVYLPSTLSHTHASPTTEFTPEETMALLLPASEEATVTKATKQDRWALGSEIAPLYSHRSITSDYRQSEKINELNKTESGLLAYAGGIHIAYATGRRLSVQSGIYYSRYGQEINKIETYNYKYTEYFSEGTASGRFISVYNSTGVISIDNPVSAGYDKVVSNYIDETSDFSSQNGLIGINNSGIVPSEDINVTLTQYFDYLELPLLVKYKIIDRKFDFSLSGGIVTNFMVGNVVNIEQNGEKTRFGATTNINQVNYLGSFGVGFEYPLVSGFAISIEPRFRYYINPIDKSSLINVHPYSFGFFAGISYVF
jgi:hypothetical protein